MFCSNMFDNERSSQIVRTVQTIGLVLALVYASMHNSLAVILRGAALYVGFSLVGSILVILVYEKFYSEE